MYPLEVMKVPEVSPFGLALIPVAALIVLAAWWAGKRPRK